MEKGTDLSIENGVKVIKEYLKTLPARPGVYRMLSSQGQVLYVGKAKSLKKRVVSYTHFNKLPHRLQRMVSMTTQMEFVTTETEADALLLEANLIKKLKPQFNILLRDDKSFPYIVLRTDHDFPQIVKHRGAKTLKGRYFGPFPSAGNVNKTITALQRAFLLRNCSDSYMAARSRPCLQYHIKRCTAPCMDMISKDDYAEQVTHVQGFMDGKSREVQEAMAEKMQKASADMDYETAALYRDRIRALTSIQATYGINVDIGDSDIVTIIQKSGMSCIQVFFYRSGQNMGNRSYFPRHDKAESAEAVLWAFLTQFYQNKAPAKQIVVNKALSDAALFEEAFSCKILTPQRGKYKQVLDFSVRNAQEALARHLSSSASRLKIREKLEELFDLDAPPKRIEVYDNSHISGTNMVGAMIVEGEEGFLKKAYRKFNIKQAKSADDYGMMREVLTRRFKRALEEQDNGETENWPDLLLIDGGLGQLSACKEALEDLGVFDQLTVVAIAKGEDRNAGREKFFIDGRAMFQLPINDPVLQYLQRLRDEAHRYAISAHRNKRSKDIKTSPLDKIEGIGAKRKKALLLHFGSAKAVETASIDDLASVEGISQFIAHKIYSYFNEK